MEKALDGLGKVPQIVQVMYFKGPPRPVSQPPETGLPQQREAQWQEFLNELQPPHAGTANSLPMEQVPWDDARAFLSAFEQVAEACRWPREEWVGRLLPALRGGVEHFFCQLDPRDRTDFKKVKNALLRADAIRRESKRQHFRRCRYQGLEGPRRVYSQLKELCRQWLKPDRYTKDEILELIIQEQLLGMLPAEVQSWVKECGPEDCIEMVALAEDFLMGRRSARAWNGQMPSPSSREAEVALPDPAQRQLFMGVSQNNMPAMASEMTPMKNSAVLLPPVLTPEVQGVAGAALTEEPEDVKNVLDLQNPLHVAAMQENSSSANASEGLLFPTPEMNPPPQQQESILPPTTGCGNTILGKLLSNRLQSEIKVENSDDDLETEFSFEGLPDGFPEDNSSTEVSEPSPEEKQDEQAGKRGKRKRKCVKRKGRYYPKEKKHTCPECGHMAYYLSDMIRHMKTHLRKVACDCPECGKAFKEKSSLEAHQKIHMSPDDASSSQSYGAKTSIPQADREYTCPSCGLSATTPENLFEHMIVHLEERRFKCPDCEKTFRCQSHLVSHQELVHSQKDDLSAHRRTPRGAQRPSTTETSPLLQQLESLVAASTSAETYGAISPSKLLLSKPEGQGASLSRYGTETVQVVLTKFAKLCNGRKHTCPECGYVSESLSDIIKHRRLHTEEVTYKCHKCGKCFKSSSNLNKHCSRNICQQNSVAPDAPLKESQMSYEGVKDPQPAIKMEEEEFEITPEGLALTHEPALSEHPGEGSLPGVAAMVAKCQKKQHSCTQCGYLARSLTDLVSHVRKHTGEKPYSCPMCKKTFAWEASFRKHVFRASCSGKRPAPGTPVSNTPFVPHIPVAECDVTLSDEEELINILANAAQKKGAKVQGAKQQNQLHRKPSGGSSAARRQKESTSRRGETRAAKRSRYAWLEKKYQCPECDYKAYYLSDLLRHQKSHGGEKPYKCPECWRAFSQPSACSKHVKTVHKPDGHSSHKKNPISRARSLQKEKKHRCAKCGHETYKLSTHLIHMKNHVEKGPFSCDECGQTFSWKSNLSRHKRIHQPKMLLDTRKTPLFKRLQITNGSTMTVELKPLKVPVLSHMDDARLAELREQWGLSKQRREERPDASTAEGAKSASAEGASTAEGAKGASVEGASTENAKGSSTENAKGSSTENAKGSSVEGSATEEAKGNSPEDAKAEAATSKSSALEEQELAEKMAQVRARLERFAYFKGGKANPSPPELGTSQAAAEEEKPQPPQECSAREISVLADPQSTDTGQEPSLCEVCGERFTCRVALLCHRSTHRETKPYRCSECGKDFIRKDSLEAHEKTHGFECSKRFDE